MNNDIIKLLNTKDAKINVISVMETATIRTVELEKEPGFHYYPVCVCRMYSNGICRHNANISDMLIVMYSVIILQTPARP